MVEAKQRTPDSFAKYLWITNVITNIRLTNIPDVKQTCYQATRQRLIHFHSEQCVIHPLNTPPGAAGSDTRHSALCQLEAGYHMVACYGINSGRTWMDGTKNYAYFFNRSEERFQLRAQLIAE